MSEPTHIGVKKIIATPMTLAEYTSYRGWNQISGDEPQEGYLLEYPDGGPSNHPKHKNYISWSPKDVFDASYKPVDAMDFPQAVFVMECGYVVSRNIPDVKDVELWIMEDTKKIVSSTAGVVTSSVAIRGDVFFTSDWYIVRKRD